MPKFKEELMDENKKGYVYLGILALVLGFCIWYIFGQSVSDQRSGADAIGTEFNGAGELIDSSLELAGAAEERIAGAEDAIRDSIERIDCIEERNSEIEDKLTRSLQLNRESQSIIQRVRERSQSDSKKAD